MPYFASNAQKIAVLTLFAFTFTCTFACMLASAPVLAQPVTTVLKGEVILNQEGGQGLGNVAISGDNAQSTTTNTDGSFNLVFAKAPGDRYKIRVNRTGWTVINHHLLKGYLPSNKAAQAGDPITIILAKSEQREHWATVYYRLDFKRKAQARYDEQIAKLQGDNQALNEQRIKLEQDKNTALALADEMAKQLAKADIANVSATSSANSGLDTDNDLYQQALDLYLNNQTDEALALLSDAVLNAELKKHKEQQQKLIAALTLKGTMLVSKLDFTAADKVYTQLANNFGNSFDTQFRAGYYFQKQNQFGTAIKAYEKAMLVDGVTPANKALALNNLGVLYKDVNRVDEALVTFNEALEINQKLAKTNSSVYLHNVANTLNNLGILYYNENNMGEALQAYKEAYQTYQKLAKTNPSVYLPDVAMTLNNLGNLHRTESYMDEALNVFNEALDIYRKLAKTNPSVYSPDIAMTLNNLGIVYYRIDRMDEALTAYDKALDIRRKLVKTNPNVYLPYVASTLNNLGLLHSRKKRMNEALAAYTESLEIRRKLAKINPSVYLSDVADTLNNLGIFHVLNKDFDLGKKFIFEAKSIYLKLAKQAPNRFGPDVYDINDTIKIIEKLENTYQQ